MNTIATIPEALSIDDEPTTEYVEIRRDGEYVTTVCASRLMAWFHETHSYSMSHALQYEGYTVHEQPERFVVFADFEEDGKHWTAIQSIKDTLLAARRAYMKFGRYEGNHNPCIKAYGFRRETLINGTWVEA